MEWFNLMNCFFKGILIGENFRIAIEWIDDDSDDDDDDDSDDDSDDHTIWLMLAQSELT